MTMARRDPLFAAARACLLAPDPDEKIRLTERTAGNWRAGTLGLDDDSAPTPIGEPGRPPRPELVDPRNLPKRGIKGARGRAALIHAVAHIELNAINLAWDAVYRFRGLPSEFYGDWVQVAVEEAYHFGLMRERLRWLGYDYGDFPAHDGLWSLARATAGDPLERMALIPRVMEARGLDVTPGMIERFRTVGDDRTADCLAIILHDEVGHVAVGTRWFAHLCGERGLDPLRTYFELLRAHLPGGVRCPLNLADRRRAGFTEEELDRLQGLCSGPSQGGHPRRTAPR
jgi:uncharacterized ferritin-like protein (DUF455 family)